MFSRFILGCVIVLHCPLFGGAGCNARSSPQPTAFSSYGTQSKLPHSMWDLDPLTRDRTHVPCIGRWIPSDWTSREVQSSRLFMAEKYPIVWKYRSLFLHSSVGKHLIFFPLFGCYEQCCYGHSRTSFCVGIYFPLSWVAAFLKTVFIY